MTPVRVRVSAVICTRGRRPYLERAFESLVQQSEAPDRYEIIVVDNASRDDTRAWLERADPAGVTMKRLHEPVPGLSRARNHALGHSAGELVAFLDDDAVAASDWIARVQEAFASGGPAVAALAGAVQPIWEGERPTWLSREGLGALSVVNWGPDPGPLADGQYVVGANMAFRLERLLDVGGFPEHLGRAGDDLISGEETYVVQRLAERGHATWYDPRVVVSHHVHRERLERRWFVRRAYYQGVSNAIAEPDGRGHLRAARCGAILLRMPGCLVRALYHQLRGDPARRFDQRLYALRGLGELATRLGVESVRAREDRSTIS